MNFLFSNSKKLCHLCIEPKALACEEGGEVGSCPVPVGEEAISEYASHVYICEPNVNLPAQKISGILLPCIPWHKHVVQITLWPLVLTYIQCL